MELLAPQAQSYAFERAALAPSWEQEEEEEEREWGGFLWAVPKKRRSYTRKRTRNAPKQLKPRSDYITCPECKNLKLLHVLCGHCLKETLRKTAEMRNRELEQKLTALREKAESLVK